MTVGLLTAGSIAKAQSCPAGDVYCEPSASNPSASCMPAGSVCCPGAGYSCPSGSTCGGSCGTNCCSSGGSGNSGGNSGDSLRKIAGEGQDIPLGQWDNFTVEVVDGNGSPVSGVEVAWQEPGEDPRSWIGTTDGNGRSSATNFVSNTAGSYTETAALVAPSYTGGTGFVSGSVPTVGTPVTFDFTQDLGGTSGASHGCSTAPGEALDVEGFAFLAVGLLIVRRRAKSASCR
ncbi:MAG: Ig-like domain-containing protein [Myxococcales bacterium]